MLEHIILGFLLHSNMSGYDIKQFMEHSISYFYDASFGSIYPMLKKMEETGVVTSMETVDGGKYRKEYAITDKGREAFIEWLNEPIALNRAKHDHLVRIFFYRWLPMERVKELVAAFIGTVRGEVAELQTVQARIPDAAGICEKATVEFGIQYYQFTIRWCEDFLKQLDEYEQNRKERKP